MAKIVARMQDFLRLESSAGLLLILAAALAMVASNTALASGYDGLLSTMVAIQVGAYDISKPLLLWINDGLMAIFFFVVGLLLYHSIHNEWVGFVRVFNVENSFRLLAFQLFESPDSSQVP